MSDPMVGSTTAVFSVNLSVAVPETVTVQWETINGTAIAGVDYEAANGAVTFTPGETEKQIGVVVYGADVGATSGKNFYIKLHPPSNAILFMAFADCTITVVDEDGEPVTRLIVAQGKRGLKGDPGISAYEQAVLMGFGGTVEDWMNEITDCSHLFYETIGDCSAAVIAASDYVGDGYFKVPKGDWDANLTQSNIVGLLGSLKKVLLNGQLTINVGDGVFTSGETCVVSAINGHKLSVIGVEPPQVSITQQVSVSGTAGNYSVTLQVNNASLIEVGNFLHTTDVTGTDCSEIHRGGWEVLSVDKPNNLVTVKNTCWLEAFPANTITASSTYVIKSVLRFIGVDAFLVLNSQVFFDNVAIVGNSDDYWSASNVNGTEKGTHGLLIGAVSVRLNGRTDFINPYGKSVAHVSCGRKVVVSGFDQQGIVTELNGSFFGDFVSACNNKRRGFYASTASGIRAKNISANGNFLDGVIADLGGQVYSSSNSCACGNGWSGIAATQNGTIIFDTGFVKANKNIGCRAYENAVVQITNADIQYNLNYGVDAQSSSVVYVDRSRVSNHTTGIYSERNSAIRATNVILADNNLHIRANTNSYINLAGATYSNGTEITVTNGACVENDNGVVGSDTSFSRIRLLSATVGEFISLGSTSTADDFVVSFGIGVAAEAFHVRNSGTIYPNLSNNADCGRTGNLWRNVYSAKFMFSPTVGAFSGSGSPIGVVSAGIGSTYHRTDGGAATSFYVKESGIGNSGWVAK